MKKRKLNVKLQFSMASMSGLHCPLVVEVEKKGLLCEFLSAFSAHCTLRTAKSLKFILISMLHVNNHNLCALPIFTLSVSLFVLLTK